MVGDVVGPSSSVDSDVVLFDGTTGKLIKDSGKKLEIGGLSDAVTDYTSAAMYLGQGAGGTGTASQNTALGYNALASLSPSPGAAGNTAIGQQTLYSNTSGQYNVAVGEQAMQSRTAGGYNVAVGMSALFAQTTGTNNVGIGYNVGTTSTTGSNNILIGYQADVPSASTSNYLNIGGAITGSLSTGPALMNGFTATTQSASDNSTKVATTAYVDAAVSGGAGASPIVGSTRNAKMSVTTASATATFTADQVIVETALNGTAKMLSSYSQSINLGTTGAGGMDTGSAPNNGWVSLYAIAKSDGTTSILACNETTSNAEIYGGANMPSGYTYSALIGVWRTNGSGQFTTGYILGRTFWHGASVNVLNNAGGASPTTYTSITLTSAVPAKATGLFGTIGCKDNNYSTWQLSTTSGGLIQRGYNSGEVGSGQSVDGFLDLAIPFDFPLPTSQTMYYKMASANNSSRMNINGYTF